MDSNGEQQTLAYELHKPARRRFQTRRTITNSIGDLWQADLVDMQQISRQNKGFKYYLAVIDTFSKMGYAEPLKTKSMGEVASAFDKILKHSKVRPKNLQTDQGLEFFNKQFRELCQKHKINHYNTWTDKKAAIVERWNRTIKERIFRKFTELNSYYWLDLLPEIVDDYNNRKHSSIGLKPVEVNKNNESLVRERLATSKTSLMLPKFKVGEWVRISRYKNIFEKGYVGRWTEEIFQVETIKNTVPIVYVLKDSNGEIIKGTFYEQEMQKTKIPDYFRIDKVLGSKVENGREFLKVEKKGYDKKRYYWVLADNVDKL